MSEYDGQTNDELREELEERDLPTDGNKEDLVARLEEDDEDGAVYSTQTPQDPDQGDSPVAEDPRTEDVEGVSAPLVRQPSNEPDEDGYVGVDPEYRNGADHTKRPQGEAPSSDEGDEG